MPLVFAGDRRIFFAHAPKAGGTSVELYLAERFGEVCLMDRRWRGRAVRGGELRRGAGLVVPPQHLAVSDLKGVLPERIDYSFAVVRDPLARLVSEYRYRDGRWLGRRTGFSLWLRLALAAARRSPTLLENHLRPQSDLVPEGAEVFRLEDGLEALEARLDALFGPGPPGLSILHRNASEGRKARAAPRPADQALIARFYAEDYRRFGYPKPEAAESGQGLADAARGLLGRLAAPLAEPLYRRGRI